MKFPTGLHEGVLLRRYKRFLADLELADGSVLTVHCPNTGTMRHCSDPGSKAWYSLSPNLSRKYPGTLEIVQVKDGHMVGVNTGLANHIVREALEAGLIKSLAPLAIIRAEVPYGSEKSRIDFLLSQQSDAELPCCYVEVKSVTLGLGDGLGAFPDAVTARGGKHLRELIEMRAAGHRAVLLFCVQHTGIDRVIPADEIDPAYGVLLREACQQGVEILAYGADVGLEGITLAQELPVHL
jgi:sugar fermentation stimulation protein A